MFFRGRRSTSSFTVRIFSTSILHTGERHYIAKIRKLSRIVSAYAQNKDASIASALEQKGTDELSSLMGQTAAMMLEMDDYMKNLVNNQGVPQPGLSDLLPFAFIPHRRG